MQRSFFENEWFIRLLFQREATVSYTFWFIDDERRERRIERLSATITCIRINIAGVISDIEGGSNILLSLLFKIHSLEMGSDNDFRL